MKYHHNSINEAFRCGHCRQHVTAESLFSGVINRNHCPYCLWSRHLDLERPGDRLCACKGAMQPVGLTLKKSARKYSRPNQGELMLIHRCLDCGRLSINRIAADDIADELYRVFAASFRMTEELRAAMTASGINPLLPRDTRLVCLRLFGREGSPAVSGVKLTV